MHALPALIALATAALIASRLHTALLGAGHLFGLLIFASAALALMLLAWLWLVMTLSGTGQLIALALLVLITIYGEFRSICGFVQRTPGPRELDSWRRPT